MVESFQFRRLLPGDAAKNPSKVHYDYIQYSNFLPSIMQIQVATNLKENKRFSKVCEKIFFLSNFSVLSECSGNDKMAAPFTPHLLCGSAAFLLEDKHQS